MSDEEDSTPANDDLPVTRVSIDTPPLSITCEQSGAALNDVIVAALALYREVYTPNMAKPGAAMGFHTERQEEEL